MRSAMTKPWAKRAAILAWTLAWVGASAAGASAAEVKDPVAEAPGAVIADLIASIRAGKPEEKPRKKDDRAQIVREILANLETLRDKVAGRPRKLDAYNDKLLELCAIRDAEDGVTKQILRLPDTKGPLLEMLVATKDRLEEADDLAGSELGSQPHGLELVDDLADTAWAYVREAPANAGKREWWAEKVGEPYDALVKARYPGAAFSKDDLRAAGFAFFEKSAEYPAFAVRRADLFPGITQEQAYAKALNGIEIAQEILPAVRARLEELKPQVERALEEQRRREEERKAAERRKKLAENEKRFQEELSPYLSKPDAWQ